MGCSGTKVKEDKTAKLTRLQGNLASTIERNKIKINQLETEISKLDSQIKFAESDLKQNQSSYSESEMKNKAKQVLEKMKDRQRKQKELDNLRAFTETQKNNLNMANGKIEEIRNAQQIQEGNELMEDLKDFNTAGVLQQNIQNIMVEDQKQREQLAIMNNGNNALMDGLPANNADDYLKQLLGS